MKKIDNLCKLKKLLESASPRLQVRHELEFKKCFGAMAGYVNGNIFISCGRFGVALKLPPNVLRGLLKEADVTHLKYFSKGHIKKEYAVIPPRILNDAGRFRILLDQSVAYARLRSCFRETRRIHGKKGDSLQPTRLNVLRKSERVSFAKQDRVC